MLAPNPCYRVVQQEPWYSQSLPASSTLQTFQKSVKQPDKKVNDIIIIDDDIKLPNEEVKDVIVVEDDVKLRDEKLDEFISIYDDDVMIIDNDNDVKLSGEKKISNLSKKIKTRDNQENLDEHLTTIDFLLKMMAISPEEFEKNLKNHRAKVNQSQYQAIGDKQIQHTFKTFSEYYNKFEKLLIMETWEQIYHELDRNETR